MSLYAIGDLHLHYQSVLKAPGQLHDRVWKNHEERFRKNCGKFITEEDTLVLVGDHRWGKNLSECEQDLQYICALPGRKILTRGNHDMFWDAKKTQQLNDRYRPHLTFLQDGYETYGDYALVATKGFCFEGPFYLRRSARGNRSADGATDYWRRQIVGWDEEAEAHAKKLVERELQRLRKSFESRHCMSYISLCQGVFLQRFLCIFRAVRVLPRMIVFHLAVVPYSGCNNVGEYGQLRKNQKLRVDRFSRRVI